MANDRLVLEGRSASVGKHVDLASDGRLSGILNGIADGVALFLDGKVLFANEAMAALVDLPVRQIVGLEVLDVFRPPDGPQGKAQLEQLLERGDGCVPSFPLMKVGTEPLSVEIRSSEVTIDGQRGVLFLVRDFSELRGGENAMRSFATSQMMDHEEERRRIAREIHDVFGQSLTALKFDLAALRRRATGESGEIPIPGLRGVTDRFLTERIDRMQSRLDETLAAARRMATDLRPSVLDALGLDAAVVNEVADFRRRTRLACDCAVALPEAPLGTKEATALFRILQEVLTNVARHAEASRVKVQLGEVCGGLELTVEDDGRGFAMESTPSDRSLGLLGLRERARACGGGVTIASAPGEGTTVIARIPLTASVATPRAD